MARTLAEILATRTRRSYSFSNNGRGAGPWSNGGSGVHARQPALIQRIRPGRRVGPGRFGVRSSAADAGTGPEVAVRAVYRADSDLQERSRHVLPTDLLEHQGSPGVLRPGVSNDVFVRQARGGSVVSRIVEARSE